MKVYGQLERAQIEVLAADPTGADLVAGRMWFRSDTLRFKVYDGAAVKEFVDLIEAQTLQNKILESAQLNTPTIQGATTYNELGSTPANPAAGNHKIYYKNDGKLYTLDSAGNEVEIGSGSGSSGKNYFDDTSANIDNTVGSWLTDDGVGGAAVGLTLAVTTAAGELLAGAGSLKLTKDAANRSAEFIKVASETIDPVDRGRALYGSFEFNPITGYVSSDLIWEVYDVTNAAVLYSGVAEDLELLNSRGRFNWVTHLEDTTAQVEFRLRMNNANTNSFEVSLDEFKFGPTATLESNFYQRQEVIDLTGSGSFTGGSIRVSRTGNIVMVDGVTNPTFASASNVSSATGLIPVWARPPEGTLNITSMSGASVTYIYIQSNGTLSFQFRDWTGALVAQTSTSNLTGATTAVQDDVNNMVNNNELSLQTFRCSVRLSADQNVTSAASTVVAFDTVEFDPFGAFASGPSEITVPKTGYYRVKSIINVSGATADEQWVMRIGINDAEEFRAVDRSPASDVAFYLDKTLYLQQGDRVEVQTDSTADTSYSIRGGAADSFLQVESVPDYTVLGAVKERNKVQTKLLTTNIQSDITITDLTCSNLVIGKWYEVTGQYRFILDVVASDDDVYITATHNGVIVDEKRARIRENTDTLDDAVTYGVAFKFQATATTLTFATTSATVNSYVAGAANRAQTYIQIEERNDLVETSDF